MTPEATSDLEARHARNTALLARPSSSGRVRFGVAVGVGVVAATVMSVVTSARFGVLVGLIVTAAVYVGWTYLALRRFDGHATKQHARTEDTGGALTDIGALVVIPANLGGAVMLLVVDREPDTQTADGLLAVGGVLLSWFLLHTFYVARYARLFYADFDGHVDPALRGLELSEPTGGTVRVVGGISFNAEGYWPTYSDFTYFAFNLGMTFQVSDTSVSDPRIRKLVLHQCLLSYFFATAITATVINLVIALVT